MSIPNRITNAYRAPCVVTTQVNNDNDACYLLRDADGKPMCAAGTDFNLATTIRDALNRPYYEALESAKVYQENAAQQAEWGRESVAQFQPYRIKAQETAALFYAEARDILNIVETP